MTREFVWPELPAALHERRPWGRAGLEPALSEALADPLVLTIMRRDGVSNAALESIVTDARKRIQKATEHAAAARETNADHACVLN
jgi:hypothetical protein